METKQAMDVLRDALKNDDGYAVSWHSNIAMMCADAIHDDDSESLTWEDAQRMGNEAAKRFMRLAFDVDTSKFITNR